MIHISTDDDCLYMCVRRKLDPPTNFNLNEMFFSVSRARAIKTPQTIFFCLILAHSVNCNMERIYSYYTSGAHAFIYPNIYFNFLIESAERELNSVKMAMIFI